MGSPSEGAGSNAPSDSRDSGSDNNKPDKDSFDRAVEDNSQRPDRAPASTPETAAAPDDDEDDNRPDDNGESSQATNTSAPSTPDATEPAEEEEDDRGFFDRAGDFFGGLARDVQDFSRENPRVDSHGNPVGLVDADGIQRGEVASRVRSSGTSSEDLAEQLGFSSPQDMAAAQNTDFIEDKYQEELARRAIEEALDERYGSASPDVQAMLASGDLAIRQANFASSIPMMDAVKQAAEMMPEIPQEVWDQTYEVMQEIGISALQGAAAGYAFGTATGALPAGVVAMADSPLPGPADIAAGIGYGIYTGATTAAGALAGGGAKAAEIALEGLISLNNDQNYHPAPKDLPAFPDTKRAKRKTPVEGGGGLRARWTDDKGKIYEWDSQHGKIEVYDKTGKRHLGEFDPDTGEQTGNAKGRARSVEK